MKFSLRHYSYAVAVLLSVLLTAAPIFAQSESTGNDFYFLDASSLDIKAVLPPPPEKNDQQSLTAVGDLSLLEKKVMKDPQQKLTSESDLTLLDYMMASATEEEIHYAMNGIEDSVFDYSEVLGAHFNAQEWPVTAAFFNKVTNDACHANLMAKNIFQHQHPPTWRKMSDDDKDGGYSYPSQHTTKAYLWADLLSRCFPEYREALFAEASKKGWSRVRIGRHFPSDVEAGELFAPYLAQKLFEHSDFQKEWLSVQEEAMKNIALINLRKTPFIASFVK